MPVPSTRCHGATLVRPVTTRARADAPPGSAPGPGGPEEQLLAALGRCLLDAFEALAVRDGIEVLAWTAKVEGLVEHAPDGLMFSSIVLSLELELAGQVARAEATLEEAKQACLVLNSLRVPVVIETRVRVPGHHEARDTSDAYALRAS